MSCLLYHFIELDLKVSNSFKPNGMKLCNLPGDMTNQSIICLFFISVGLYTSKTDRLRNCLCCLPWLHCKHNGATSWSKATRKQKKSHHIDWTLIDIRGSFFGITCPVQKLNKYVPLSLFCEISVGYFFQKMSFFPCLEIIPELCVRIITLKSMFCYSLWHPQCCSIFQKLNQTVKSLMLGLFKWLSHLKKGGRALWFISRAILILFSSLLSWQILPMRILTRLEKTCMHAWKS
jgi:hypothetical protein